GAGHRDQARVGEEFLHYQSSLQNRRSAACSLIAERFFSTLLALAAHRRGPLPHRGQPRTRPLAVPPSRTPGDRACKSQPGGPPAPGHPVAAKAPSQGRAGPRPPPPPAPPPANLRRPPVPPRTPAR